MPDYNITLPQELAYDQVLPVLPSGAVTLDQFLPPINGSTFSTTTQGTQIIFDLPARGHLIPSSLYLRYSYAVVNTATTLASVMLGNDCAKGSFKALNYAVCGCSKHY